MAKKFGFIDATENIPEYTSDEYSDFYDMISIGIAYGYKNELEVTSGTGLQVVIDSGGMTSRGRYFLQDENADGGSPETLEIDPATSGYLRKDRIVVEYDLNNFLFDIKVSKGAEATSNPSAPALVDTSTKWEESLAIVNVSGGTIASIEDDRTIQGARVNTKDFPHDISAPNITLNAGGKIYLGSENNYIYLGDGKLMIKLDGCVPVQIATVLEVGTSSTPPTDIVPINTTYLERES